MHPLAEDGSFEEAKKSGVWQKIKDFFIDLLTKVGVHLGHALTDNELCYILWRSYENLAEPRRYRSILGEAEDVAMQDSLKVGNYAVPTLAMPIKRLMTRCSETETPKCMNGHYPSTL